MKRFIGIISLVFVCSLPVAGQRLSKSIEFDRYLLHARNAILRGDYRDAADNYERAEKLRTEAPEGFYLDYAASLGALGEWKSAKSVLTTYFQHFDKQGRYYDVALRRYVDAEERVERHSVERVRPELQGVALQPRSASAPKAEAAWIPQGTETRLPAMPPTAPPAAPPAAPALSDSSRAALERLIGSYSGEARESEEIARGNGCDDGAGGQPRVAHDCFYGYHRSMSLNAVDGSAVVGFVKVEYVREHRPGMNPTTGEVKPTTYRQMEYYLSIRLWMTPGGLIQGQQKALCEFIVAEKTCVQGNKATMTPLRAKLTQDGGLAMESDKGGGSRVYAKMDESPDAVRGDVVRVVPSLGAFTTMPSYEPERPVETRSRPALGDTAYRGVLGSDSDDLVATGIATTR